MLRANDQNVTISIGEGCSRVERQWYFLKLLFLGSVDARESREQAMLTVGPSR